MDMSDTIGTMKAKTRIPGSGAVPEQLFNLQKQTVVDLISEIVRTVNIVGHESDGSTVYLMRLSPTSADTLAALFAHLDELDRGENEHDGREPDPEDLR